jgi:hypothetical protein
MTRAEYTKRYNETIKQMDAEIEAVREKYADILLDLSNDFKGGGKLPCKSTK